MGDTEPTRPPRSVAEVLRAGRLPDDLVRVPLARFRVTDANGVALTRKGWKGGGVHVSLSRPTAEAAPVPGLVGLKPFGVERDGGAHILHSFFSVPVEFYGPDRRLFGCYGELPSEGLPTTTEIPVPSFAVRRGVSAMLWEYHIVHLEGVSPSSWKTTPCEWASSKAEGRNLTCRGITFLPPDVVAPW